MDPVSETPIERTLRLMRRQRRRSENNDQGNLLGIGKIKQMVGGNREAVRGDLIALVARGDVEVIECINGIFWRATAHEPDYIIIERNEDDGHFILQREVIQDSRAFWFDADIFTSSERAKSALEMARWEARARAGEYGRRAQRIRLIKVEQGA